jgi:hypothetical protein
MPDTTPTTPAVWIEGDPLMEAIAANVWEQCATEQTIVVDDPRNIAAVAATTARQVLGTTDQQPETAPTDRSTAPLAAGLPLVTGRCPACGTTGLFLGDGGYVTCSLIDCPAPDAASTVLERGKTTAPPAPAEPCTEHPNCYTRAWDRPEPPDRATEFELRGDTEIRAAALREAADEAQRIATAMATADEDWASRAGWACASVATGLRRLADEAQQPTAEATSWPSTTEYAVETREADQWIGISFHCLTLAEARDRRDTYRRRLHAGRFRIVRWDETATVVETDPEPAPTEEQPGTEAAK